jgi:hypothetical protein
MGTYTLNFPSEDDYEAWLAIAGPRINVLTIRASEVKKTRNTIFPERTVVVRYRTSDRDLVPRRVAKHAHVSAQWKLAPVFTFGALLALLAAYAVR